MTRADDLAYDPTSAETARDPYPLFRRLREEAPLYYSEEHDFWALSRREDVERAHLDKQTFISGRGVTLGLLKTNVTFPPGTVIFEDPPTHTIHRALLSRMFTPRRVSRLEPMIRDVCARLLDPLVGTGRLDWARDLGDVMPSLVIGMLIGLDEQESTRVRDHFHSTDENRRDRESTFSGQIFAEYVDWRIDHPSDDIVTTLLNAEFEDETGKVRRLRRDELLAYINIVAAAGNDTTRLLIGWTGKLLSDHPDQRELLVRDPSLIPSAIEEVLRFEAPPIQSCRYVAKDVVLHGQTVPEGSALALLLPSANRDHRCMADPDTFDVRREPGQIFSFGFGSHFCLGHALARLQARIALDEVLRRFPSWEADEDEASFSFNGDLRGWSSYPVAIDAS